ncbi:hypothetical protein DXG01_008230, partial [Tephrocybe rancida]
TLPVHQAAEADAATKFTAKTPLVPLIGKVGFPDRSKKLKLKTLSLAIEAEDDGASNKPGNGDKGATTPTISAQGNSDEADDGRTTTASMLAQGDGHEEGNEDITTATKAKKCAKKNRAKANKKNKHLAMAESVPEGAKSDATQTGTNAPSVSEGNTSDATLKVGLWLLTMPVWTSVNWVFNH